MPYDNGEAMAQLAMLRRSSCNDALPNGSQVSGNLGRFSLQVLAEGIEGAPTWQELREKGCEERQGCHIAEPPDKAGQLHWLRSDAVAEIA